MDKGELILLHNCPQVLKSVLSAVCFPGQLEPSKKGK